MESVRQEVLSDRERLAVVENNIHNIKNSQSEFKEEITNIQKEVSDLSGLIKVNNALLTAMSDDLKTVKGRTEFVPKAVLSTVVALGLGFVFTQATSFGSGESQAVAASSLVEARMREESLPTQEEEPDQDEESKD